MLNDRRMDRDSEGLSAAQIGFELGNVHIAKVCSGWHHNGTFSKSLPR